MCGGVFATASVRVSPQHNKRLGIEQRLTNAKEQLDRVSSKKYLTELVGSVVRQNIAQGEPLIPSRIVRPNDRGFLAAILVLLFVVYTLLVLASLFSLLPLYLVVITALKDAGEINLATTWRLPERWNWSSFATAWEAFAPKLYNSLMLGVCATAGSALLGSVNGYVLSKWSFRGANVVFPLMLFGMFIPYQAVMIPLLELMLGDVHVRVPSGFDEVTLTRVVRALGGAR